MEVDEQQRERKIPRRLPHHPFHILSPDISFSAEPDAGQGPLRTGEHAGTGTGS